MRKIILLSFITMDGAIPAAFTLIDSMVSPNGVIIASYQSAGELETGSFA